MRYLDLADFLLIAEAVTGISADVLEMSAALDLADSALHSPQAGFGDEDAYPEFSMKAAVLCVHIAKNHALPDGNKRAAWMSLRMFCERNDYLLDLPPIDEVVETVENVAAGTVEPDALAEWLEGRCNLRATPVRFPTGWEGYREIRDRLRRDEDKAMLAFRAQIVEIEDRPIPLEDPADQVARLQRDAIVELHQGFDWEGLGPWEFVARLGEILGLEAGNPDQP